MLTVLTLALVIFFLVIFGFLCLFGKMTNNYYACSPCCWLLLKTFSYIWFKKMKLYFPSPLYFVHKREKSERKECPSYCQQAPLQPGVCQHSRETIKGAKKSKKSQIGKQKLRRFVVPFSYFTVTLFFNVERIIPLPSVYFWGIVTLYSNSFFIFTVNSFGF